ncbi:hypothetical protein SAMN04488589_1980 [Methanolobus vulcani]|uniref:DUF2110 family protein n=1 Tax=Methanolobus vulcani TaxID=38026 RepID=A0A7Z7B079_9EURY|nr:DUF2110 family protein [Methanolobus vulcani]SDG03275.1 hypothetical protein SAMN04488589_1980 [Methanolobus vulcani]
MVTKLLIKIYGNRERATHSAEVLINNELKELDASAEFSVSDDNWLTLDLKGEDSEFASNFLIQKFGSPVTKIMKGENYHGFIRQIHDDEIVVDAGVLVTIPRKNLNNLGNGTAKQIATRFGIIRHLPVKVEITDEKAKEGIFTREQADLWWSWKKSHQDRVIANSVTRSELKAAIKKTGHARDIYGIERLGLMEHMITCRENTDGPGIVAAIGKLVKGELGVVRTSN